MKILEKKDRIKAALLYFFLICGGIYNFFDTLRPIMAAISGPLLIFLGIWMIYEYCRHLKDSSKVRRFLIFSAIVILLTWIIELIGVRTGFPFGSYIYSDTLFPAVAGVPLAIGFAWIAVFLGAAGVLGASTYREWIFMNPVFFSILSGFLMTAFDFLMEPASINLGFWQWHGSVPVSNYAAWFVIGFIIAFAAIKLIPDEIMYPPPIIRHFYWAQIIYFVINQFRILL